MVAVPDGRMFYLCHAYLAGDGFCTGRQPVLHELEITGDGWPRFKTGSVAMKRQPAPFKGTVQKTDDGFHDSFNGKELKEEWSWNYTYADISVSMENGVLILSGAPLNGNMYGTALCVRAQETDYVFETEIVQSGQQLKGLTLYGDSGNMAVWGYRDGKLVRDRPVLHSMGRSGTPENGGRRRDGHRDMVEPGRKRMAFPGEPLTGCDRA